MQIVIAGGGKVGSSIAAQLLQEGHQITIIDQNEAVIDQLSSQMDLIGCVGNGASYALLKSLGMPQVDLLIAVTETDEVNMLCCLIAHKLGAKQTIARVRNPEYAEQLYALKKDLGLSLSINPERATALEIDRILRFPSASSVELFAKGRTELVSCDIPAGGVLDGVCLRDLQEKTYSKVLVCAVDRGGEVVIPSGDFVIHGGDTLYMTGEPANVVRAFRALNMLKAKTRNAMLVGGSRIAYYLGEMLIREGVRVKILERDPVRAKELADLLPEAVVLLGDASDQDLLYEEGLEQQDAFIALTGLDEGNILSSLSALRAKVPRVIAKVNNDSFVQLVRGSGLQSIVSPKHITANYILRYVRALNAGSSEKDIISLHKLVGGKIEVIEFEAEQEAPYLNIPLKDLRLKRNILIASIAKGRKITIPGGMDMIEPGNLVVVVTANVRLSRLADILETSNP